MRTFLRSLNGGMHLTLSSDKFFDLVTSAMVDIKLSESAQLDPANIGQYVLYNSM